MRECSVQGIHRRRKGGTTRRNDDAESSEDLVNRNFDPDEPNRLWLMDITEHPTRTGKVYLAAFGRRLRESGLLGSMGSIRDCYDNSLAESFFGTLQLELLDEHVWDTREQLANAIFEWIETWYNPKRRHSYTKMLSPIDYETATAA